MKKRQVVLYVFVMLILLTTSVYATVKAELEFVVKNNYNNTLFYAGDEFTLTIGLKNVEASLGIKSIEGYIDIDENVFEDLTLESIVTDTNGKVQIGNNALQVYDANNISSNTDKGIIFNTHPVSGKGDYKIVINLENPISTNTDLVTLKFKIKNVAAGSYSAVMSYKLFTVFSTDTGEKAELEEHSYGIDITERPASGTDNNSNNTNQAANNTVANNTVNTPTNNTTNNIVNNTAKDAKNTVNNTAAKDTNHKVNTADSSNKSAEKLNRQDNTVSPTNSPKTGYRIILIPIIAMVILGFVFYKKYSKYNNYHE